MKKENSIIIYQDKKTGIRLETHLKNESVWLTAQQIAILFGTQRPAIVKHINNVYKTAELNIKSTCSILEQIASERHFGQNDKKLIGLKKLK